MDRVAGTKHASDVTICGAELMNKGAARYHLLKFVGIANKT